VINPTYETERLAFTVEGAKLDSQGESWVLTGPDDMAFNDPGKDPVVKFTRIPVPVVGNSLEVQPVSATIFVMRVR